MSAQVISLFDRKPVLQLVAVEAEPAKHDLAVDDLIEEFLRNYKGPTSTDYARSIRYFRTWCLEESGFDVDLYEVRRPHVADWLRYLEDTWERKPATIRKYVAAVSALYSYARDEGYHDRNPAAKVERPQVGNNVQYTGLNLKDVERLAAFLPRVDLRSQVVVTTLLLTGLRVSEFCKARVEGLTWDGSSYWLDVVRKRGYEDRVEVPEATYALLHEYLDGRASGPLVLGDYGDAIARQVVWRIVRTVGDAALPHLAGKLHPHDFRHSFLSGVLRLTRDVEEAMRRGGHRSPKHTMRYLHALDMQESTTASDLEELFGVKSG